MSCEYLGMALDEPLLATPTRRPHLLARVVRRGAPLAVAFFLSLAAAAAIAIGHAIFFSPMFSPSPVPSRGAARGFVHRGVNLGGWLVLEPWVTPSMIYPFLCNGPCPPDQQPVIDERSFCERLGPAESLRQLERMRSTWVTEATLRSHSRRRPKLCASAIRLLAVW